MRLEPVQLLRYIEPVGNDGDLLRQPLRVHCHSAGELRHRSLEPGLLLHEPERRAFGQPSESVLDDVEPLANRLGEPPAFFLPHLRERLRCLLDDGYQLGGRAAHLFH